MGHGHIEPGRSDRGSHRGLDVAGNNDDMGLLLGLHTPDADDHVRRLSPVRAGPDPYEVVRMGQVHLFQEHPDIPRS
jgi:hypothetical protein